MSENDISIPPLLPLCPKLHEDRRQQRCAECIAHTRICETIAQVESTLALLQRQELDARTRMNHSHERLHDFPPEITSRIFELALEEGSPPLFLGRVCKAWRHLAWSTPSLWTDVDFLLNPRTPNGQPELVQALMHRLTLLGEIILRSGALPLKITIFKSNTNDWVPSADHLGPLLYVLHHNFVAPRLANYSLQLPPESFISLPNISAPNLRSLTLQTTLPYGNFPTHTQLINLELLTRNINELVVRSLNSDCIQISYDNLTHVEVTGCPPASCIKLLHQATNLQCCVMRMLPDLLPRNPSEQPTVLRKLTKISLFYQGVDHVGSILGQFTFPALQELVLPEGSFELGYQTIEPASFLSLLERSRCPLKSLSLPKSQWITEDLTLLLSFSPTLTSLSLHNTMSPTSMADVLSAIFPFPIPSSHPKVTNFTLATTWTAVDSVASWAFLSQLFPPPDPELEDGGTSFITGRHYPSKLNINFKVPAEEGDFFRLDDQTAAHINSLQRLGCHINLNCELLDGAGYRFDLMEMYQLENEIEA